MNFKTAPPTPPLPLLRPMEIGELLDEAFDLYKKNFRLFFGIAVLVSVPFSVLSLLFLNDISRAWAMRIANDFASLVSFSALVRAALSRRLARPITILGAYRQILARVPWVFAGAIIYGLAFSVGLVLFVFPGIVVALWGGLLLLPVILTENRGWSGVVKRPRQLAEGNLWRLFFAGLGLLLIWLIVMGVLAGFLALVVATVGFDPTRTVGLTSGVGRVMLGAYVLAAAVVQSAWIPILTTTQALIYLDLRIRREAYDVELLTTAVEARVAAARAAVPPIGPLPDQVSP